MTMKRPTVTSAFVDFVGSNDNKKAENDDEYCSGVQSEVIQYHASAVALKSPSVPRDDERMHQHQTSEIPTSASLGTSQSQRLIGSGHHSRHTKMYEHNLRFTHTLSEMPTRKCVKNHCPTRQPRIVPLLVTLIVISCLSFLYLSWTMDNDRETSKLDYPVFDISSRKERKKRKQHQLQTLNASKSINRTTHPATPPSGPVNSTNGIYKMPVDNLKMPHNDAQNSTTTLFYSALLRPYPRVIELTFNAIPMHVEKRATNTTMSHADQYRQYSTSYHRVAIPNDTFPPLLDETNRSSERNTSRWDHWFDLPTNNGDTATVASFSEMNQTTMLSNTSLEDDNHLDKPATVEVQDTCLPMADWMTASFVNCNSIHEIDLQGSVLQQNQTDLVLLGQGWFRSTWKYTTSSMTQQSLNNNVVIKMLRMEREFLEEYYDLHRRDAVAMERLTFSPFVIDVYGYCGQSAINELAEGVFNGEVASLEQLNRRVRGRESDLAVLDIKLQLATSIAIGLAHVHNLHISESAGASKRYAIQNLLYGNHTKKSLTGFGNSVPTMAHYDINPRNIAIMKSGKPKLNDFNIAEFLTYNITTNQSCGFRSRLHEPWWRAPEEMDLSHSVMITEKVDVYALGNVLYHILTTHSPRGKMKKERIDEVRQAVRQGFQPPMLEPFVKGDMRKNKIVKAFIKAMDLCYEVNPTKRGSAIQVAKVLHKALKQREKERGRH